MAVQKPAGVAEQVVRDAPCAVPPEGKRDVKATAPVRSPTIVLVPDAKVSPAYFSVLGAAKYCSLSRSQVFILLNQGLIPSKKCGSRTLISKAAIDEYVASLPERKPSPGLPDYAKNKVRS